MSAKKKTKATPTKTTKRPIDWPKEWNANEGWPLSIPGVTPQQLATEIENLGGNPAKGG